DLKRRIRALRAEIAEAQEMADERQVQELRREVEAITSHLASTTGLGGRPRTENTELERARQRVKRNVNTALRILKKSDKETAARLQRSISGGYSMSFVPSDEEWDL